MRSKRSSKADRIVVGVDGSEPSKHALRWALEEAHVADATVKAVTAWQLPDESRGLVPHRETFAASENAARHALEETVRDVASEGQNVPEIIVREGDPADILLDEAEGARLLVVGNRGHGRLTEALLGSVGQHVIEHAACPVVVTR